jgi:hypothetical protein
MVRGIPKGSLRRASIREQYERYLPWMSRPGVHVVRYEQLVGRPEQELGEMLAHLRRFGFVSGKADQAFVSRLRERMSPAKSETFRKGGAGGWREHFTDRNRAQFEEVAGDLLQELGYGS